MSFNLAVILRESAQSSPDQPVAVYDGGSSRYVSLPPSYTATGLSGDDCALSRRMTARLKPMVPPFWY